jgi:hypothetical protein
MKSKVPFHRGIKSLTNVLSVILPRRYRIPSFTRRSYRAVPGKINANTIIDGQATRGNSAISRHRGDSARSKRKRSARLIDAARPLIATTSRALSIRLAFVRRNRTSKIRMLRDDSARAGRF